MASTKDLDDIDFAWQKLLHYAGFPNGGPNLTSLLVPEFTVEVDTLYVDPILGHDKNQGTQPKPFKTLQHALESLPFSLQHEVYINIIGTITEQVRMPMIVPLFGTLHIVGGTIPDYIPRTLPWREILYRSSAPTDGFHNVGSLTFDITGATIGWICTTAGTPGTWVPWSGGGGGGISALLPVGVAPNANGATISGSDLNLEPASATFPGIVTAGTQSFGGNKDFLGSVSTPTLIVGTNKIVYAGSRPVTGSWSQGDITYNVNSNAGGNAGWICVAAGSPGDWCEFGLISTTLTP